MNGRVVPLRTKIDFVCEVHHDFGHSEPSWGIGASSGCELECHVRSVVDNGDGLISCLCTMCDATVSIAEIVLCNQYPTKWMVISE